MGDRFKRVATGDPVTFSASSKNAVLQAARSARVREAKRTTRDKPVGPHPGWLLVQNLTGQDRGRWDVLAIDGPVIAPDEHLNEFETNPTLRGVKPRLCHRGRFVVLLEDVPAGQFGRAAVSGITPAVVDFGDGGTGLDFADVASGAYTLKAGFSGSAQILWSAATAGNQWALVRLSNNVDGSLTSVCSSDSLTSESTTATTESTSTSGTTTTESTSASTSGSGTTTTESTSASTSGPTSGTTSSDLTTGTTTTESTSASGTTSTSTSGSTRGTTSTSTSGSTSGTTSTSTSGSTSGTTTSESTTGVSTSGTLTTSASTSATDSSSGGPGVCLVYAPNARRTGNSLCIPVQQLRIDNDGPEPRLVCETVGEHCFDLCCDSATTSESIATSTQNSLFSGFSGV